jgi:hypothetical protein
MVILFCTHVHGCRCTGESSVLSSFECVVAACQVTTVIPLDCFVIIDV